MEYRTPLTQLFMTLSKTYRVKLQGTDIGTQAQLNCAAERECDEVFLGVHRCDTGEVLIFFSAQGATQDGDLASNACSVQVNTGSGFVDANSCVTQYLGTSCDDVGLWSVQCAGLVCSICSENDYRLSCDTDFPIEQCERAGPIDC